MPGKPEVLIVGINSFLGRAIYELLKNDCAVTGVYHRNKETIPHGIKLVQSDRFKELKGDCL